MTDPHAGNGVPTLLRLIARTLERVLEGDELAFDALQQSIDDGEFTEDDLETVAAVLRSLATTAPPAGASTLEGTPGPRALRVPSEEERLSLSPEAWGFLLDLRRRGSLSTSQFERVLELLLGTGVRPVDVELAREAAAHVALGGGQEEGDASHGEDHVAN